MLDRGDHIYSKSKLEQRRRLFYGLLLTLVLASQWLTATLHTSSLSHTSHLIAEMSGEEGYCDSGTICELQVMALTGYDDVIVSPESSPVHSYSLPAYIEHYGGEPTERPVLILALRAPPAL